MMLGDDNGKWRKGYFDSILSFFRHYSSHWLGIEGGHVARRVRQFFFAALDVHVLLQRWCHQLVSS